MVRDQLAFAWREKKKEGGKEGGKDGRLRGQERKGGEVRFCFPWSRHQDERVLSPSS